MSALRCPPPINQSGNLSLCLRCVPAGKNKNKIKKEPESHKQTASVLSKEAFPDHRGGGNPLKAKMCLMSGRDHHGVCARSTCFPVNLASEPGGAAGGRLPVVPPSRGRAGFTVRGSPEEESDVCSPRQTSLRQAEGDKSATATRPFTNPCRSTSYYIEKTTSTVNFFVHWSFTLRCVMWPDLTCDWLNWRFQVSRCSHQWCHLTADLLPKVYVSVPCWGQRWHTSNPIQSR